MNQASQTRRARSLQRWSDREAVRIKDSFLDTQSGLSALPTSSWRSVTALILASLVLLGYVLILLLGLWSVRATVNAININPIQVAIYAFLALMCLTFSWLARPNFRSRDDQALTPQQAPELYALLTEVAGLLHAPVPRILRINGQVNAFVTREGFPPRFSLTLGLPLIFAFHPQELLDLLAHELAHEVNGDPLRGQWIAAAINVLYALRLALYPDRWDVGGVGTLTNGIRWLVVLPVLGLLWVFDALLGEASQRAEYRADLIAASISGSEAAVSGLDKLHFADLLEFALQKQRSNAERPHAFLELRHAWDHLKLDQWERRRAEVAQHRLRLDSSHPPTTDRIEVVKRHALPATLILSAERVRRIENELTPFVARIEAEAYDVFRERYSSY